MLISVSILFRNTTVSLLDISKGFDYSEVHQSKRIAGSRSKIRPFFAPRTSHMGCSKGGHQVSGALPVPVSKVLRVWIVHRDRCVPCPAATIVGYVTN